MSQQIVRHNIFDPINTQWRVRWAGYEASDDTWDPLSNIKDIEVFHDYCANNKLQRFIPQKQSKRLREEEDGKTSVQNIKRFKGPDRLNLIYLILDVMIVDTR